jgi:hypothetical protein
MPILIQKNSNRALNFFEEIEPHLITISFILAIMTFFIQFQLGKREELTQSIIVAVSQINEANPSCQGFNLTSAFKIAEKFKPSRNILTKEESSEQLTGRLAAGELLKLLDVKNPNLKPPDVKNPIPKPPVKIPVQDNVAKGKAILEAACTVLSYPPFAAGFINRDSPFALARGEPLRFKNIDSVKAWLYSADLIIAALEPLLTVSVTRKNWEYFVAQYNENNVVQRPALANSDVLLTKSLPFWELTLSRINTRQLEVEERANEVKYKIFILEDFENNIGNIAIFKTRLILILSFTILMSVIINLFRIYVENILIEKKFVNLFRFIIPGISYFSIIIVLSSMLIN